VTKACKLKSANAHFMKLITYNIKEKWNYSFENPMGVGGGGWGAKCCLYLFPSFCITKTKHKLPMFAYKRSAP
jgi:hypothetical protein